MRLAIRPTVPSDIGNVGQRLRPMDRLEVTLMSGLDDPCVALNESVRLSTHWRYTCTCDGLPEIIYGVAPTQQPDVAAPWMLGTDIALREAPKEFMYLARREVLRMQECAALLYNYTLQENTVSIKWLKALGFCFGEPTELFGHTWLPFTRT